MEYTSAHGVSFESLSYPPNLGGPFELHVVIELADEPLLQQWMLESTNINGLVSPKLTGFCAFYGDHPIHLMLSAFFHGTVEETMCLTERIAESFALNKIRILRVKIESNLHARGVPERIVSEQEYYEVHIKVTISTMQKWKKLAGISRDYDGHLFLNNRSKSAGVHAIVTVRSYKTTLEEFEEKTRALLDDIASNGFDVVSTRSEYSCYDSSIVLDKGWLY